jgi:fibronectin-binding autotransporter adhesin
MKIDRLEQTIPMKTNEQLIGGGRSPKRVLQNSSAFICLLLGLLAFSATSALAQTLIWDAGNTNNGATIDPASGSWDVSYFTTNYSVPSTTTIATTNANLVAGGIDWFQVNVPAGAWATTNILLYATNLPVNVWFSLSATTNNVGDVLLMTGVTTGVRVLTTTSVPTNIVPGGIYYLGIDNTANANPVGYALEVDLSLTNNVTITRTNLNWNTGTGNTSWIQTSTTAPLRRATFNGPDAPAGTYQVVVDNGQVSVSNNLTINASGYTFSGSPIDLRNPTATSSATNLFFIADGKSVIFSNNLTGPNNGSEFLLGSNGAPATVVLYGTLTGFQPRFTSTNGSIFYLAGPGTDNSGTTHIDADVRMTNGVFTSNGAFIIGRLQGGSQPFNGTGVFTVGGTAIFNQNQDYLSVGRDSIWNSTLIVQDSGTLNVQTVVANNNPGIGLPRPGSSGANDKSLMYVYGGTVNMGGPGIAAQPIQIANGGSRVGEVSLLTQTGGVINAWGGIQIGGTGTYDGGSGMLTNSGGFLYLGSVGGSAIRYGSVIPPTNNVSLSGGTLGALQSWISSVPMTLATLNGNITFQCADGNTSPFNISLSGSLTGLGGFNKTGGGILTLTGTNNYAGITTVSNGTLLVSTINLPKSGDIVLDGSGTSSGLPILSNSVPSAGQTWTMTNLTVAAGTPTIDFQFGALPPSATVAPIQANGNVTFTVTPNFAVDGTAIPSSGPSGYPLIHYTGTYSGPASTSLVYLPFGGTSGYITNIVATKTLALVINSTVNPSLTWGVGNGLWDIAISLNWKKFGVVTNYHEGDAVTFDDTASGTSPITITLNTTVNPASISAINNTKAYIISGTGAINGTVGLNVAAAGSLTLATTNTYTGGTAVSSPGQLNINYGGNGGANSAIGTGALNLNTGAKIDNTSGHAIVLNTATSIPVNWIDDWTFVGTTNLDLGFGQVTLGNVQVILTVVSNTLTVGNQITDNGLGYQLVKQGNGALTLSNANTFSGGFQLAAGTLNINADGAVGSGIFAINGGTLDNTSGATVALENPPASITLAGNVVFKGTTNLNLGPAIINVVGPTVTLNKNTLITEGDLDGHNTGVTTVNGPGTWDITGGVSDNAISFNINGGTVLFDKAGGNAINGGITTVNTNGTLVMAQATGIQMSSAVTLVLGGGTVDLNGDSETITTLTFNSGTLRNSAPTTTSTLTATNTFNLVGANCAFDVTTADSSLTINRASGSGGLVKAGLGLLNLTTNSYAGNTTISNGTLVFNFPTIATNSTITVNTNATLGANGVLTLTFANAETNTVAALVLGGVSKPAGIYNATTDPLYIAGSGSLQVVPPPLINALPGPIQFSVSGSTLALSWPTNLGWMLQSQTNALNVGLTVNSNSWFDISNSVNVTSTNITINPANPTVFFRLRHP